jgi:hypothetical protein
VKTKAKVEMVVGDVETHTDQADIDSLRCAAENSKAHHQGVAVEADGQHAFGTGTPTLPQAIDRHRRRTSTHCGSNAVVVSSRWYR